MDKARKRLWTLRHSKKAGICEEDLLKMFNVFIRPILEYAAPTFHSMLNGYLRDQIEQIQKRACKLIYGWNVSYDELIMTGKVVTLEKRRELLALNFAKKCTKNDRFKDWFKEKPKNNLRSQTLYEEKFARTEGLKKSPLYYLRRALNNE